MLAFNTDPRVRVQDDLFLHVNGRWLESAEIPGDRSATGAFYELRDESEIAVRDIVTGLAGADPDSEAGKVERLYASFRDEPTIESLSAAPLAPYLAEIDAIGSIEEFLGYLGRSLRRGTGSLLALGVESDPGEPTRYALFAEQSGLGLPDEEYYRLESHASVRDDYQAHIGRTLALAGLDAQRAGDIVELERQIATHHWDKVKTRDLRAMYNPTTLEEYSAGVNWRTLFEAAGVADVRDLVDAQPSFGTGLGSLLTEDQLDSWRWWARWHLLSRLSPYLSSAFVDERFHFYGTTLEGIPTLRERWKRGISLVEGALGEAVGKLYVERHFSPLAKERMDVLVANLVRAYRDSIGELDWMTQTTKAEALTKLDKFVPKIGFPDLWRDYSALEISADDLIGNVIRSSEYRHADEWSKLGGPLRRWEWLMTPQTVNAYYHPLRNEIVFPAAILRPPFFDEQADDAVNYGAIGSVIGHEIGHGFDDQGSTCDGDGALRDWWTAEDRTAFEARAALLIDQYNALEPVQAPGNRVNGALTIGENIGDLGGLSIAYKAWRIALGDTEPEPIDGLSGAQRLFFGWARAWQSKIRTPALLTRMATDPHSPDEFRCNQVARNIPAFYEAFGVSETDRLWLPPEERVRIW
ncbi:MAG: peptidase M13 [Micropruina sp.]|nr:peptidase M13 [Micropruina sp.]